MTKIWVKLFVLIFDLSTIMKSWLVDLSSVTESFSSSELLSTLLKQAVENAELNKFQPFEGKKSNYTMVKK